MNDKACHTVRCPGPLNCYAAGKCVFHSEIAQIRKEKEAQILEHRYLKAKYDEDFQRFMGRLGV